MKTRLPFLFLMILVPAATLLAGDPEPAATYADVQKTLGFVPSFVKFYPGSGIAGAWEEQKALEFSDTAIPGKYKSLISLAVAAQVPCAYCVYADSQAARAEGATEAEVREAIAMSAITRHWSTVLNGSLYSEEEFRKEFGKIAKYVSKSTKVGMAPAIVTDAASAYKDIEATLGIVPGFFRAIPESALPGAWKAFKGIQLNPNTAIPPMYKELIGLAVSAQIPCRYCSYFHTEAAKMNGASAEQVKEALAMAALTRHWSTIVQGAGTDLADFKNEIDRLFTNITNASKQTP